MKRIVISALTLAFLAAAPIAYADYHEGKAKWDTNGDGQISKSEFINAHEQRFSEIDTNNDGQISKEEMKAQRAERKEKMKERREAMKEKKEQAGE